MLGRLYGGLVASWMSAAGQGAVSAGVELAAERLAALNCGTAAAAKQRPQWLLFNDFAISPMPPAEVRCLYDGQKVPVLLYYTQVRPKGITFPRTLRRGWPHSC